MKETGAFSVVGCLLLLLLGGAGQAYGQAGAFDVFAMTDLVRVFEDGYHLPAAAPERAIRVFGMRGEHVSAQAVIHARTDLQGVTVEVGPLALEQGSGTLPAGAVTWNFVGSIPLRTNAPNQHERAFVRPAPARYPDYLMDADAISLQGGQHRAVWLTIRIPEAAQAGVYSGAVTVRTAAERRVLPLSVEVLPLTLPDERHLKVTEWFSTDRFEQFHGIEERYSDAWFRMLRHYAENMAAHRQNTFRVGMNTIAITRDRQGGLAFDFSTFDRIADVFWSTEGMDYLETGFLARFGEGGWNSTEIVLKDFAVQDAASGGTVTLPGDEVIPALLPAFEKHLAEKGWLEKTFFHVQDEPTAHNAVSYRKVSAYMHGYAPRLTRMDALETTLILDDLEVAVPKLDHFGAWYDTFREALKTGRIDELWFYSVGIYQAGGYPNKTIDLPLMDNRMMHWLNYRYDATGFLHWGYNYWTEDPFEEVGQHLGDGWHVYPKKDGLMNSLRWEQMRNGLQDYEYFWMLEERVRSLKDSLGGRFAWIAPDQRGKEIISRVVTSLSDYVRDPGAIYRAKRQAAEELLALDAAPRLYVQTNPPEGSRLQHRGTVELMGWAEPGSSVEVNGKALPVAADGLFLERFMLTPQTRDLTVKVRSSKGETTTTRSYEVVY